MFLLNRGYHLKINEKLTNIQGIISSASAITKPEVERRTSSDTTLRLFDPQVYFPLDKSKSCKKTFTKLSTYPVFNPDSEEFNSREFKINEFKKDLAKKSTYKNIFLPDNESEIIERIKLCIDFQISMNASHIILPTPLINDSEDGYSKQLKWINSGIKIIKNLIKLNKPVLISVALSENIIISKEFKENTLLQTILDNLTSYYDIDGFYIVIEHKENNINIYNKSIVNTVLEFSYILGNLMNKTIVLNFIDILSFLGLSVGADLFGGGYTNKERRLNFQDFDDKEGYGISLPHFYSHSLIGDLFSDRDLSKLRDNKLLYLIKDDITQFSSDLYNTLDSGLDVSLLTEWRETRSNTTQAILHRIELINKKSAFLDSLDQKSKIKNTLEWLMNAEMNTNYILDRLKSDPLEEDFKHVPVWRECFEEFIEKYSLL